ncbi:hypothetical protein FBU30_002033 [Linnemannia zychae]|nr:hypothetical protein FBU30_002033 [Linnemannia zychae]
METIYGIQADTETLREAHEHQRRMQQRLQEQQSSAPEPSPTAKKSGLSMLKPQSATVTREPSGLAKPSPIARSTSASALPPLTTKPTLNTTGSAAITEHSTPGAIGGSGTDTGYSSPGGIGSSAASPSTNAIEHSTGPAQHRSTAHSPTLFSKFYDVEHRLPWLSLPGAVGSPAISANGSGGEVSTSMFGRRRSDVGLPSSGRSTPSGLDLGPSSLLGLHSHQDSSQQEISLPLPPQPQPQAHSHHHGHSNHHHLLGPQEIAALSRHSSPMPLNEALPHYLRKKNADSSHSMERSFSSPGSNSLHPPPHPGSPFMLPLNSSPLTSNSGHISGGSVGQTAITSPSHLLFPFPGSTVATPHPTTTVTSTSLNNNQPEMERASSTGALPVMNRSTPHSIPQHHSHLGIPSTSSGPGSASNNNSNNTAASFFRTLTPVMQHHHGVGLGSITGLDLAATPHSGIPSPSKFGGASIFGHHANSSDRDLSGTKEVHA